MRSAILAAVAVVLLAVPACGRKSSTEPNYWNDGWDFGTNDRNVIVALGDSVTEGAGDSTFDGCFIGEFEGYPRRLQAKLGSGKRVINEGRCGEGAMHGEQRVGSVLAQYKPGYLLILYGYNDRCPCENIKTHLRNIIRTAKANKTIPIIGTMNGDNPDVEAMNPMIRDLAREEGIIVADIFQAFESDSRYQQDHCSLLYCDYLGLHPNDEGYEVMAQTWYDTLVANFRL